MMQFFTIPGKLSGYNQLTEGHWAKQHKLKSGDMKTVCWIIREHYIRPISGKAAIKITCYEPNKKRDPSNVRAGAEKIILDALQNMGIIKNDNWARLEDCPALVELDRKNPRIEVVISEVE